MKTLVFCRRVSPSSCVRSLNLTGTNIKLIYGKRGTCDILTRVCVMQHLNILILKCYCFCMVKAKSFPAVFFECIMNCCLLFIATSCSYLIVNIQIALGYV